MQDAGDFCLGQRPLRLRLKCPQRPSSSFPPGACYVPRPSSFQRRLCSGFFPTLLQSGLRARGQETVRAVQGLGWEARGWVTKGSDHTGVFSVVCTASSSPSPLTGDRTHNLGIWGRSSTQPNHPARALMYLSRSPLADCAQHPRPRRGVPYRFVHFWGGGRCNLHMDLTVSTTFLRPRQARELEELRS